MLDCLPLRTKSANVLLTRSVCHS